MCDNSSNSPWSIPVIPYPYKIQWKQNWGEVKYCWKKCTSLMIFHLPREEFRKLTRKLIYMEVIILVGRGEVVVSEIQRLSMHAPISDSDACCLWSALHMSLLSIASHIQISGIDKRGEFKGSNPKQASGAKVYVELIKSVIMLWQLILGSRMWKSLCHMTDIFPTSTQGSQILP